MGESVNNSILKIDVEEVLKSKNPALAKAVPRFAFNYLKKVIHQDEINMFLGQSGHLKDFELVDAALNFLNTTYKVSGSENIPKNGKYIFVSNHPLGGLDGLVFIQELSKYFTDIKFPVNDILTNLQGLSGIFLPVNKHGSQDREAVKLLEKTYSSESQILYFPAGLCSRKTRGQIRDLTLHKSFIAKAVKHQRDIVPAYFGGKNSNFFYNLAKIRKFLGIKANIEMLYLPDEMFRQRGKEISLVFGKPIPWTTFDKSKTYPEWAEWVKIRTYELEKKTP